MEVSSEIIAGKKVLLIWHGGCSTEKMKDTVEDLRSKAGPSGSVLLEHAERLIMAEHSSSSFDVVLSGVLPPPLLVHSSDILEEFVRILKPSGTVLLAEPVVTNGNISKLRSIRKLPSAMKFSGFVKVSECSTVASGNMLTSDLVELLEAMCGCTFSDSDLQTVAVVEVRASKPSYEVGASTQLSFANHLPATSVSKDTAKIWSLSADDMMEDDLDLVDPDSLLAEEDLKKPDPESLRSTCGSAGQGKRKACKNCTCGLAEDLAGSGASQKSSKPATSSCGNCYLGDAFRCASCPYLGMPAFKPGEKITLSDRQLRADQ